MDSTPNDKSQEKAKPSPEEPEHRNSINWHCSGEELALPELLDDSLSELRAKELSSNWQKRPEIEDYDIGLPEGDVRSVRLPNGQTLWLIFDHCGIDVLDKYSRTDLASLGVLAAFEAREAKVDLIRKALSSITHSIGEGKHFDPPWQKVVQGDCFTLDRPWQIGAENVQYEPLLELSYDENKLLRLAFALARHSRLGFDSLPDEEQCRFLTAVCERIDNVAKSMRQLAQLLEYGTGAPGEKLRSAVVDAKTDVKAAELYDIRGLSYREVGMVLGILPTERDEEKRDPQSVRKKVKRGRKLANEALDGEWKAFAARAARFRSRSQNQKDAHK